MRLAPFIVNKVRMTASSMESSEHYGKGNLSRTMRWSEDLQYPASPVCPAALASLELSGRLSDSYHYRRWKIRASRS